MRSNNKKVLGALAVAGLVATTGSAFTAGLTVNDATETVAYGTATVSGATVDSIDYVLSTDGAAIASVVVTLHEDHAASDVNSSWDGVAMSECVAVSTHGDATTEDTAAGDGYDSVNDTSQFTCNGAASTITATQFAVAVDNEAALAS